MLISPIYTKGLESIEETSKTSAASILTASRLIGMTLSISWISSWGTSRFQDLTNGVKLLPLLTQTNINSTTDTSSIQLQISKAGLQLFNDFFLIAAILCIIAIIPVLLIKNSLIQASDISN
jgi:hypothetical protein